MIEDDAKELELENSINEFLEMFPDLPNPDNCPIVFSYYVSLYRHIKSRES